MNDDHPAEQYRAVMAELDEQPPPPPPAAPPPPRPAAVAPPPQPPDPAAALRALAPWIAYLIAAVIVLTVLYQHTH